MISKVSQQMAPFLEGLSEEEVAYFFSLASISQVPSQTVFFRSGRPCEKMWFLVEGAARMFRNKKGKDYTLHIFNTPRFFTDYLSIMDKSLATYSFQTLTDCVIVEFDVDKFYGTLDVSLKFERVGRKILEVVLYQETSRLDDFVFNDATQRYHNLQKTNPVLFNQIPQKYIASYLRITPETLSRIRKC